MPRKSRKNKVFRRVRKNRRIPPAYLKRLQVMGSGSSTQYFESNYSTSSYDSTVLLSATLNQTEFRTKALNWIYMKLINVTLSIFPTSNNHLHYFLMLWTNDDSSRNNVEFSDSTKKITVHTTRIQHLYWKPPNAVIPTGNTLGHTSVNLRDWIVIDDLGSYNSQTNLIDYYLPGRIAIYSPNASGSTSVTFCVTLKIAFRGSKFPSVPGLISSIINFLPKEKEEDKEEVKELIKIKNKYKELNKKGIILSPVLFKEIEEENKKDEKPDDGTLDEEIEEEEIVEEKPIINKKTKPIVNYNKSKNSIKNN